MKALEARVAALEQASFAGTFSTTQPVVDEAVRRARRHVEAAECYSAVWRWVPEPYYTWPLAERAVALGAGSVEPLCKSLLLENKKATLSSEDDPTYPRLVLVIIQYAATLDLKKLTNALRALRPVAQRRPPNEFDFRLASEADNARCTGYLHNAVTPFGLLQPDHLPIILSAAVVPLGFIWMGGGHQHLKLGLAVPDLIRALQPLVADISSPRVGDSSDDNNNDLDG